MATENPIPEFSVLDKKDDDKATSDVWHVSPSSHGEPIVTRRELWSYYCKHCKPRPPAVILIVSSVYFFGGSVLPF
jgi:hypothetical protein